MKTKFIFAIITTLSVLCAISCDSNDPGTAGSLIGTYRLSRLNLKDQGMILYADQSNNWMGSEATISGTLSISATTYSLSLTIEMNSGGFEYSATTQEDGTYTATESTITMTSDDGETQNTYSYSFEDQQLLLENDSEEIVFTRI